MLIFSIVVGDVPELGKNNVKRAVRLNVMEGEQVDVWSITIPVMLRANCHSITYRYFIATFDDDNFGRVVRASESTTRYII